MERAEQSQLRKSKRVFDKFMKSKRKLKQISKQENDLHNVHIVKSNLITELQGLDSADVCLDFDVLETN